MAGTKVPTLRHWFSGSALLGVLMMAYSVAIAMIQMPQEVTGPVRWLVLIAGLLLAFLVWYSLAKSNADSKRRDAMEESRDQRLANLQDTMGTLVRATQAVESRSGSVGEPVIAKLNEQIAALGATVGGLGGIPIRLTAHGVGFVTEPPGVGAERPRALLAVIAERIAAEPPTTPEAAANAVRSIDGAVANDAANAKVWREGDDGEYHLVSN